MLGIKPDSAMLLIELLVYDEQNHAVAFKKNLYRGDRYKYYHRMTS